MSAYDYVNDAGRRTQRVDSYSSGDGLVMFSEVGRGVPAAPSYTNTFVYGPDLSGTFQGAGTIGGILLADFAGTNVFFAYDANGNVTELVATNGTLAAHYEFDPYGNVIASSGDLAAANPYRFSSKYTDDETGLVYYGHRFYSPELGRWTARDPIGTTAETPTLYVRNSPLNMIDSLGLLGIAMLSLSHNVCASCNGPSDLTHDPAQMTCVADPGGQYVSGGSGSFKHKCGSRNGPGVTCDTETHIYIKGKNNDDCCMFWIVVCEWTYGLQLSCADHAQVKLGLNWLENPLPLPGGTTWPNPPSAATGVVTVNLPAKVERDNLILPPGSSEILFELQPKASCGGPPTSIDESAEVKCKAYCQPRRRN